MFKRVILCLLFILLNQCKDKDHQTITFLAFGQSNSANHGKSEFSNYSEDVVVWDGSSFRMAVDPMPMASGSGRSVWPILGRLLIDSGNYSTVRIISIGEENTSIMEWSIGGTQNLKLLSALENLKNQSIKVTHVFFHQGETDAMLGTKKEVYIKNLEMIYDSIKRYLPSAPMYVALATYCRNEDESKKREEIRSAQKEAVSSIKGIFLGPDTDVIGSEGRRDRCHFNNIGLDLHAQMWLDSILPRTF